MPDSDQYLDPSETSVQPDGSDAGAEAPSDVLNESKDEAAPSDVLPELPPAEVVEGASDQALDAPETSLDVAAGTPVVSSGDEGDEADGDAQNDDDEDDALTLAIETLDPDDPDFDEKVAELVAFFSAEPVEDGPEDDGKLSTVATGESWPTESGYKSGTYPQAQAEGLQFDKPGPQDPTASGKQEEADLPKSVEVPALADNVGKHEGDDADAARALDAAIARGEDPR